MRRILFGLTVVGIEEKRQSDGYGVRLPLTYKLLFFSQVIGLFIVKLVLFDTRNVVLCVDDLNQYSAKSKVCYYSKFRQEPKAFICQKSTFIVYLFSAAFKVNNYLFFMIFKFLTG